MFRQASCWAAVMLLVGCGSAAKPLIDSSLPTVDKAVGVDQIFEQRVAADTTEPACGAGVYPCGPYGIVAGATLENHELQGFRDPNDLCLDNDKKQLDLTGAVPLSMKTFFKGDASCPAKKKQLLWVLGSAAWCATCLKEVKAIEAAYGQNQIDSRVAFFNVVVDGLSVGSSPTESITKSWINATGATFPVAYDAKRTLAKYFTATYFPFNMLVDLATMKIYYAKNGDTGATIGTKISQFFQ